jgi:hypothetical protein
MLTELQQHLAELQENNAYDDNLNLEVKQENIVSTNDEFMPQPNMVIDYHQNNKALHYPSQVETSPRTLIFDTKDLF